MSHRTLDLASLLRRGASGRRGPALATTLVAAAVAWAGCGNLTAGGISEVTVAVSGDADIAAAPSPAPSAVARASGDDPEGEVEAEFDLFLVGADGGAVALTDEPVRVRVDVRGRQEAEAVRRVVPAQNYTALRMVFVEIEVEVEAGLVVNGVPVVGDVEVELEDGTVTVERPVDLAPGDGDSIELLLDLNTTSWLVSVDPDLRRIAEEIFAAAVRVEVR